MLKYENKNYPRPLREREIFVNERSEFTKMGVGSDDDMYSQVSDDYAILRSAQNDEKRAAFTKPSRGTNEVRNEHQSTETLSFRCWCERCRLMRGAAFTLAEVLITLGIIGVVASITLPPLIHNIKNTILKNQFKHQVAFISELVKQVKVELNVDKLVEYCTLSNSSQGYYYNNGICWQTWYSKLRKGGEKGVHNYVIPYDLARKDKIGSYNKVHKNLSATDFGSHGFQRGIYYTSVMTDGTYLQMTIENHTIYVTTDINGAAKPNLFGHDIFVFELSKTNDSLVKMNALGDYSFNGEIIGSPCDVNSTQKSNGIGCGYYALIDKCPDGSNRGYFECLP